MHDGTINRLHRTLRICQKDIRWVKTLQHILLRLGYRAWLYREGMRSVFVVEWRADIREFPAPARQATLSYARGYFDAEGGVPRDPAARFYIQLVQKDLRDLRRLQQMLADAGIMSGRLHNPSRRVDPDYWRFYVSASSHRAFGLNVGSWHPIKRPILFTRLMVGQGPPSMAGRAAGTAGEATPLTRICR